MAIESPADVSLVCTGEQHLAACYESSIHVDPASQDTSFQGA